MRPRGSIITQLLVTFCVFAVLIGIAAVAGFVTVADQDQSTRQLTAKYTALQQVNSQLETAFGTATFTVLFHAEAGQRGFLAPLATARAEFGRDLAVLRREATPEVRAVIGAQARPGWAPSSPGRPPPRSSG
jgi:CHASE3 domain sensor protein